MTAEPTIDYEGLAQEAMRGLVRTVLARTAKSGLVGDHHFYISFDTNSPGVTLSKRLKEKYPHEMTIVLQHRFWDLAVSDERFEVKLTFDGIPERLVVPFAAVKVFFDPSVRFGLQFEDQSFGADPRESSPSAFEAMTARNGGGRVGQPRKVSRGTRKPRSSAETANSTAGSAADKGGTSEPTPISAAKPAAATPLTGNDENRDGDSAPEAGESAKVSGGAEIVSLDKFRKK